MIFKAREDFKHGTSMFEEGNSYDSIKHGLSDSEVNTFHGSGWVSIHGKADVQRTVTGDVSIVPKDMEFKIDLEDK